MADFDPSGKDDPQSKLAGILKKAVSIGAATYLTAEDTVTKTLNTVQIPKELLRETLENFFENYTLNIQAEIKLVPKRKDDKSKPDDKK